MGNGGDVTKKKKDHWSSESIRAEGLLIMAALPSTKTKTTENNSKQSRSTITPKPKQNFS
jgi:hypothetical protein